MWLEGMFSMMRGDSGDKISPSSSKMWLLGESGEKEKGQDVVVRGKR
jgi:hypothetical protein